MSELDRVHPFERAGFGHAPYKCTGHARMVFRAAADAPAQPGTCCDYCGTGIMDVYFVKSSDGVEFKVGCDCIAKTLRGFDKTIPEDFRAEFAKVEYEKREARRIAKLEQVGRRAEKALAILDAHPWLFASAPHPFEYHCKHGKTLRDYYEFVLKHGGSGRAGVCRDIETANQVVPA